VAETCFLCGCRVSENERLVLVRGKRHQVHCSESCLRETIRRRQLARTAARRRWFLRLSLPALLLVGAGTLWKRHRAPERHAISYAWPEGLPVADPPPAPIIFGPPWPPTDEQWTAVFDRARWTYPLPGPIRRAPTVDGRILGPEPPREHPALCRAAGHCGIDLGGELWGEHVYAALDGVVERVQGDGNDRRGGHYVRLSHMGGMVFTQYFHLAAAPRGLAHGVRVRAGDVIGLVGDTGLEGARRHLHFALSIRPSSELQEVYWDPTPWLLGAPLRVPPHGTVAGFAP
jgi:murein DD-endopeptidase MepM/ murein hydrolase activator NlpD